jgi:hypothetical protein
MTCSTSSLVRLSIATLIGAAALLWGGNVLPKRHTSFVSSAEAVTGRPLTPLSYAGVARRTTRRAVGAGVAAGAVYGAPVVVVVVPAPVVVAPTCVQAVDAYGRIYSRCY